MISAFNPELQPQTPTQIHILPTKQLRKAYEKKFLEICPQLSYNSLSRLGRYGHTRARGKAESSVTSSCVAFVPSSATVILEWFSVRGEARDGKPKIVEVLEPRAHIQIVCADYLLSVRANRYKSSGECKARKNLH